MKRTAKILLILLSALLILILGLFLYYFIVTANVKLQPDKLAFSESAVTVYDIHGEKVDSINKSEHVRISSLPEHLPNAFVAVEDKRFYSHHGLDYKRMAKAALKNLASFSFREGASTISQQLIKNTHLSNEKTINRKLKEIKLTLKLEKQYSKSEILELYMNSIYFGHSAFGIQSAANYYFNKEPKDLNAAESATLAALVRSPNRYSPFRSPEKCLERRNYVLSLMHKQGMLSETEKTAAQAQPLPQAPAPEQQRSAYLDYVFEELSTLFPDTASGDSLKVFTYLDPDLQRKLEETKAESDMTILVRDNKKNAIKALHSTCGILKRLPASTIKPLAIYAPAIEENLISPATPILDEKIDFGGYSPSNYSDKYHGYVSARYALAHSVNIPAVKILNMLGTKKAASYLEKMNLNIEKEDETLALALGGISKGFTLPALSDGYAIFANGGRYNESRVIRRVEDGNGDLLFERCQAETLDKNNSCQGNILDKKVFSEDTCALINDILKTAAKEGTAKKLKNLPYPVCAKTGTGGSDAGNIDAYTIAYTASDTVSVWLGNRDNTPIQATGGGIPANIALQVLEELYRDKAPQDFPACEEIELVSLDKEEYENNHRLMIADPTSPDYLSIRELFKKSALPNEVSSKFSKPIIQKPLISVKNGAVEIILCQTYYYDYEVKRECDGKSSVIYRGKYRKEIFDNSVQCGKKYTYTVTPFYQGIAGESVTLPSVFVEEPKQIPEDWWEN